MDRTEALKHARVELDSLGLNDWELAIDARPIRRLGQTRYASRTIGLSAKYVALNPWNEIRVTVRHESAHALVGAGCGHGPIWKAKARELGVPTSWKRQSEDLVLPRAALDIICPRHGVIGTRARRPSAGRQFSHNACGQVVTFERRA